MHSSLQISGPQSQLRSRVLIGGSVSQSHSDHGAQSPGSHFSKDLFSHIILLIEKVTKMSTYHMVRYCKVLLRQSLLRILVWVNQFLVHRNRVRSSNFWYGVEFLNNFNFINRKISKTFKRISRISKETQKISQKKSKEKFKKFQKNLSD